MSFFPEIHTGYTPTQSAALKGDRVKCDSRKRAAFQVKFRNNTEGSKYLRPKKPGRADA